MDIMYCLDGELVAIKDQRLQIRMTIEEMAAVKRRADAVGLSVAEYARKLMLAGPPPPVNEGPMSLDLEWSGNLEGEPAATYAWFDAEAKWEGDQGLDDETKQKLKDEHGIEFPDWVPTIPNREPKDGTCNVKGVPPGVRCIKCGKIHGS